MVSGGATFLFSSVTCIFQQNGELHEAYLHSDVHAVLLDVEYVVSYMLQQGGS